MQSIYDVMYVVRMKNVGLSIFTDLGKRPLSPRTNVGILR